MFNDIDIFWINCSENRQRYEHINNILEKRFPNNKCHHIEAIMHKPKYNGITMAHMVAIMKGMTLNHPFIILEDDVTIPNDFLSGTDAWSRISKNIPGDWDIVYLGMNGDVEGSPIADNIVKLSPYKKGQWGTYAYVVKHGSIKTKLLPALRFMTDSIDEQYNTLFGDINAYCIRPSLIRPNEEVCNTSSIDA